MLLAKNYGGKMAKEYCSIGVDLGGTKIAVALVDGKGRIGELHKYATDVEGGPDAITRQIVAGVKELQRSRGSGGSDTDPADFSAGPVIGVGVGVAGQIQADSGLVHFAPNLDWREVPLKADLEKALDLPVVVTNDVRAITWGEWLFGAGKGVDDLICMFVGTGIGGGVVAGGKMLAGSSNTAGEIGHITIDMHGPLCTCGNRGCLEVFAGGWAIGARAQNIARTHPEEAKMLLQLADNKRENLTAEIVATAYHKSDPVALHLVGEATEALAAGMVSLINTFNPRLIILGGGVIDGLPEIIDQLDAKVRWRCLSAAATRLGIVAARLGGEAGVVGAAALAAREAQRT